MRKKEPLRLVRIKGGNVIMIEHPPFTTKDEIVKWMESDDCILPDGSYNVIRDAGSLELGSVTTRVVGPSSKKVPKPAPEVLAPEDDSDYLVVEDPDVDE